MYGLSCIGVNMGDHIKGLLIAFGMMLITLVLIVLLILTGIFWSC